MRSEPFKHVLAAAVAMAMTVAAPCQPAIAGRVLDVAGRPAPGAAVTLRWRVHPELPGAVGISLGDHGIAMSRHVADRGGRFVIRPPHPGPFLALAEIEGQRSAQQFPVMAGDALELKLEPAFDIGGVLLGAEREPLVATEVSLKPHHGAWNRLASYRFPEPRVSTLTDAEGVWRLPFELGYLRQPHRGILLTVAASSADWQTWMDDVVLPLASSRELVVPLRGGRTRGRIVDEQGSPVRGAVVLDPGSPASAVRCDDEGAYEVPAWAWQTVVAHAPGFAPAEFQHDRQNPAGVEVLLRRGLRVRATLRGPDGRAVAGARVLWALPGRNRAPIEWLRETAPNGSVEFDSAPRRRRLVGFVEIDGLFTRFCDAVLDDDADLGEVEVGVERTVRGEVRDHRRAPIPHARVALWMRGAPFDGPPRITYASRGGRFRFDAVPPGGGLVSVDAGGQGCAKARVSATEAAPELTLTTSDDHRIDGIVIDTDDQPIPGAWVTVISKSANGRDRPDRDPGYAALCTLTGADGRFTFRGLPGEWIARSNYFRDGALWGGGSGSAKAGDDLVIVTQEQRR